MADWAALTDWAAPAVGTALTASALKQLRRYAELLRLWNRKVALVSRRDIDRLVSKHLADALFAAAYCCGAGAVADLGSGAGLPGVVVAITQPSIQVTLIEARGRKVSFLEEVCRDLALPNVAVQQARIEALAADPRHRGRYDLLTARALAELDQLVSLAAPLAAPGGRLLAMRTARAPVPEGAESVPYTLPDGTPRRLTILPLPSA